MVDAYGFLIQARALGCMDVGQLRGAHRKEWRVVVTSLTEAPRVYPCASREEANELVASMPRSKLPPNWSGAHVEHPDGYTPTPPRRLPIYGERPIDRAVRDLREAWTFGQWLMGSESRIREYAEFIDLIDHEQNPFDASLADVESLFLGPDPTDWVDEESGESVYADVDDWFSGEFGYDRDEMIEIFGELRNEWLALAVRRRGIPCSHDDIEHRCHVALTPIDPWPTHGGVYFARAGDRVKIGKANNVAKRITDLQTGAPFKLELLAVSPGGLAEESAYHRAFKPLRVVGEWFRFVGAVYEEIVRLRRPT